MFFILYLHHNKKQNKMYKELFNKAKQNESIDLEINGHRFKLDMDLDKDVVLTHNPKTKSENCWAIYNASQLQNKLEKIT